MNNSLVYQIVGYKNTGKTHLMCRLITFFTEYGIQTATIKHDGHSFEADPPNCDTRLHREAGATWSAITSRERTVIVEESATTLHDLVREIPHEALVLVEGFKEDLFPKMVLIRCAEDEALAGTLQNVTAVAVWPDYATSTNPIHLPTGVIRFHLNDTEGIANHIQSHRNIYPI